MAPLATPETCRERIGADASATDSAQDQAKGSHGTVKSLFEEMAFRYENLPKQLQVIARFIESNRARMVVTRITDITSTCGVQPSAVTRFAQRFGFSGYSELQELFRNDFIAGTSPSRSYAKRTQELLRSSCGQASAGEILRQLLLANQGAIEEFTLNLDHCALGAATKALRSAGQIYVVGMGRSHAAAIFLTYLLQHTSKRVHLVNGIGGNFVGQVYSIGRGDVLVAISFTRYSRETRECVTIAAARGAKVLAITDSALGPVTRAANVKLLVGESNAFSFRSLTNTMCLCQALFIAVASHPRHGNEHRRRADVLEPDPEGAA